MTDTSGKSHPAAVCNSAIRNPHSAFQWGLHIAALIAVAFAAALVIYPIAQPAKITVLDITPAWLTGWQIFLGISLGGGGILGAALTAMRRERAALAILIGAFATFMLSANFIAAPFDTRSTKTVSLALRDHLAANPSAEVYSVDYYFQDIPVYANRLVNVVDYLGELEFGVKAEPEKSAPRFIDAPEFSRRWQDTSQRAYAIVEKRHKDRYFSALPHTILAQNTRHLLLVNTPSVN
jgi:pimeloyl-ACP methyl ester carboxylesterase